MKDERKGLSLRERRLIMLMLIIGVTTLMVVYIIIPLINTLEEKRALLGDLEMRKMQIETSLLAEQSMRDNLETARAGHDEICAQFLSRSLQSDIGRLLTQLCEEHNLQPVSQNLSAPENFRIDPGNTKDDGQGSVFLTVTAAMAVKGGYDELRSLLDTVEQTGFLRVIRLSFGRDEYDWPDIGSISITFEVTMLKDLSPQG